MGLTRYVGSFCLVRLDLLECQASLESQHIYRFNPAILRTNKQIESEARRVLYYENLLVRIHSDGSVLSSQEFQSSFIAATYGLPILAGGDFTLRAKYPAMEVNLLTIYSPPDGFLNYGETGYWQDCFLIASDDLPTFCWILLMHGQSRHQPLEELTIAIEMTHDIDMIADKNDVTVSHQVDVKPMSPRISRLLEPFRSLHYLKAVHIEGPVDQGYITDITADMCGPIPTEEDLFERVTMAYQDAMDTYYAGHTSSAITKLKHANDVMEKSKRLSWIVEMEPCGEPWGLCEDMQFNIWYILAKASFQNRDSVADVQEAYDHLHTMIDSYVCKPWVNLDNAPPMGREIAMVLHFFAEVLDTLYNLGDESQDGQASVQLKSIIEYMEQGLRHYPGNEEIKRRLKGKKEELLYVEWLEDLMGTFDRINEGQNMRQVEWGEEFFEAGCNDVWG